MSRRALLTGAIGGSVALASGDGAAFGDEGAFNPRILLTGASEWSGRRRTAPARWALEVVGRTSAPARLGPTVVRADAPELLAEPFAIWSGSATPDDLTRSELINLRRFFALGGVLLVDDQEPTSLEFSGGAKKQLGRVVPQGSPIAIGEDNVIFRSFYLLSEAAGRMLVREDLEAIVRGGTVRVIFCANDLLGALARGAGGVHPFDAQPGGEVQREKAVRLAVNIAMYVLCSNYKDDQVHAPFLMRRRASGRP
ncbi:MAG: DUF4159 domain-containing protein [Polyangiaceae bacterium]